MDYNRYLSECTNVYCCPKVLFDVICSLRGTFLCQNIYIPVLNAMYCNFSLHQLLPSSNPAIMSFYECLKSLYLGECEIFHLIHSLIKLRWHGPAAVCLFLFSINFSETCEILIAILIKIKTKII